MDQAGAWYKARILQIDYNTRTITAHFMGWHARYDLVLRWDSTRVKLVKAAKASLAAKVMTVGGVSKLGKAGKIAVARGGAHHTKPNPHRPAGTRLLPPAPFRAMG